MRRYGMCFSGAMFITGAATVCTTWYVLPASHDLIRSVNPLVWISLTALGCLLASIPVAQYILIPIIKRIPILKLTVVMSESELDETKSYSQDHRDRIRIAEVVSQNAVDKIDSVLSKSRP